MSNQLLSLEPRYRVILPEVATTTIIQVGVGGTGSWLAMSLARLVYHAGQAGQTVKLVLVDPDTVEERNVGRQGFSPAEVGQNKAESMALRLSLALGIEVAAAAVPFVAADFVSWANQQYRPYGSDKHAWCWWARWTTTWPGVRWPIGCGRKPHSSGRFRASPFDRLRASMGSGLWQRPCQWAGVGRQSNRLPARYR
jgi:hypothetical protein